MPGHSGELVITPETQALVEPYVAGGIVAHATGGPVERMDGIIHTHVERIRQRQAGGDTTPARTTYVINPANGLLIGYSYRQDPVDFRQGYFAEAVELDDTGRPRHGVSALDPFYAPQGFIPVHVQENDDGFPPSAVTFKLNEDDPETAVAPNIEMANLVDMLRADQIPHDVPLEEFAAHRREVRRAAHDAVRERNYTNYRPSKQGLDRDRTNPDYQLLITNRSSEAYAGLVAISKELSIFPIVISVEAVNESILWMQQMNMPLEDQSRLKYLVQAADDGTLTDVLREQVPAFVTLDFQRETSATPRSQTEERHRAQAFLMRQQHEIAGPLLANPFFSQLINNGEYFDSDFPEEVRKLGHGHYELPLEPSNADCLVTYGDWLRASRLNYLLTLYLRGLERL